jgi:hypothetical protein
MRRPLLAFFLSATMLIALLAPAARAQLLNFNAAPGYRGQLADLAKAADSVIPTPLAAVDPVPEPRTAAVGLCGLFVAVLVGRGLYIRYRRSKPIAQSLAL